MGVVLIMLMALPLSIQFYLIQRSQKGGHKNRILLYLPFGLVAVSFISAAFSQFRYESLVQSFYLLALVLIYQIISRLVLTKKHLDIIVIALFALGLVESLIAIFNYLVSSLPSEFIRMSGTFYWPNPLAAFLLVSIIAGLYLLWIGERFRYLLVLGVSIILSTLILTYSKGAYLSLAPLILILIWQLWHKLKKGWQVKVALFIVVTSLLTFGLSHLRQNGFQLRSGSLQTASDGSANSLTRVKYWRGALDIFHDHKLVGSGPATFGDVYPRYQKTPVDYAKNTHNFYLETLAETGVFGFLILIIFSLLLIIIPIRTLSRSNGANLAIYLALLGLLIHSTVDVDLSYPALFLLFFMLAGLAAGSVTGRKEDVKSDWTVFFWPIAGLVLAVFAVFNYYSARNYSQGKELLLAGDYSGAYAKFSASINFLNENPRSDYYLAQIDYARDNNAKAETEIDRALSLYPVSAPFFFTRGRIVEAAGNDVLAIDSYLKAIENDPKNNPNYYISLTELYLKTGRKQAVRDLLTPMLKSYNDQTFATLNLNTDLPAQIKKLRELLKLAN